METVLIRAMLTIFIYGTMLAIFIYCHYRIMKIERRARNAHRDWDDALRATQNYSDIWNETHEKMNYQPSTLSEILDADTTIEQDISFKLLLRKSDRAYIAFLETHPSCIHKDELIGLLGSVEEEKSWQKIMNFIFDDKASQT